MLCCCYIPRVVLIGPPSLRLPALVFGLLHVPARHPLPPCGQPLTAGAAFARVEAVAMVAGVALWRARGGRRKQQQVSMATQEEEEEERNQEGGMTVQVGVASVTEEESREG